MNLYLINATNSANAYGLGTYFKELTQVLKDADISIHMVHLHSTHTEFEIVKTEDVENWYVPEVRDGNTFVGTTQNLEDYCLNVAYLLRLYIKDTKDLIFHFNFNNYHFLAKKLKSFFACKTLTTIHYTKWAFDLHGNLSRLHALRKKPENQRTLSEQLLYKADEYEVMLYKEVDSVIVLSKNMQNLLCSEYKIEPDKTIIIPNGLEDINPQTDTNKAFLRKKWCISENESLILFTGRLHAMKGPDYLIRAFRKVLKKKPNCRLIIAGNGAYDSCMKECEDIWKHVTWTGRVDKDILYELYAVADIGVMPSLYEPFGYVAVEMMMHGLPIVATAKSGLNEVVDDTCGLKVPIIEYPDRVEIDTDLLAEKMLYLLQHPEERQRMSKNARKRYETVYTAEIFRQNMLDYYRSLFHSTKQ